MPPVDIQITPRTRRSALVLSAYLAFGVLFASLAALVWFDPPELMAPTRTLIASFLAVCAGISFISAPGPSWPKSQRHCQVCRREFLRVKHLHSVGGQEVAVCPHCHVRLCRLPRDATIGVR